MPTLTIPSPTPNLTNEHLPMSPITKPHEVHMSRTSDRTLLAAMSFADPDHKDRRHTLACQYLARADVAQKVLEHLKPAWCKPFAFPTSATDLDALCGVVHPTEAPVYSAAPGSPWTYRAPGPVAARAMAGQIEVPILRNRGYLVGFWDVVVPVVYAVPYAEVRIEPHSLGISGPVPMRDIPPTPKEWRIKREASIGKDEDSAALYIEVKAGPCDIGDLVRQLATYRTVEAHHCAVHIAATCWPMSEPDRATLTAAGVHHVRLGAGFEDYVRSRSTEDAGGWDV